MRHAQADDLEPASDLLAALRAKATLAERRPGVFYRGGRAFLHFHADESGLFADVRLGEEWERVRVTTSKERRQLLDSVAAALAG